MSIEQNNTKLGIMQPYFFPYIGYFQLIHATDRYIFFDTPQYERRSWMNRNRIINLNEGSTYITVPVIKAPQQTALTDIVINNNSDWRNKIYRQLEVYKKIAPYYNEVIDFVHSVLDKADTSLAELNVHSVVDTCRYIGLDIDWDIFSQMNLEIPTDCAPDEWALEITKATNADEYINAPGGARFFDRSNYETEGIKLQFIQPEIIPYNQRIGRFEPCLSIIDVMMYNSPEEIFNMLAHYAFS